MIQEPRQSNSFWALFAYVVSIGSIFVACMLADCRAGVCLFISFSVENNNLHMHPLLFNNICSNAMV